MIILGIEVRSTLKVVEIVSISSSSGFFSCAIYMMFFLCGEAEIMTGWFMHNVAIISEHVAVDAVAVRAIMFTPGGSSALTSPKCLYSGLNVSHLLKKKTSVKALMKKNK